MFQEKPSASSLCHGSLAASSLLRWRDNWASMHNRARIVGPKFRGRTLQMSLAKISQSAKNVTEYLRDPPALLSTTYLCHVLFVHGIREIFKARPETHGFSLFRRTQPLRYMCNLSGGQNTMGFCNNLTVVPEKWLENSSRKSRPAHHCQSLPQCSTETSPTSGYLRTWATVCEAYPNSHNTSCRIVHASHICARFSNRYFSMCVIAPPWGRSDFL